MTEQDQTLYMEALASKLMGWMAIEDSRSLTGIERVMSIGSAQEYDAKVALGWPDTLASSLSF